ncbi:phosphotransferase [Cellulosimicrobium marinum]|uniref:phosphotransferase n=1 Tax=Cellulosimicrobium marinum TaxID=1638992 RepID=UPI001E324C78|nr:phosphotransferase [Cellulosimicrobium marinum]MCB7138019.1 phosphotransferase [Cellulosimicrobium marinum]
MPDDVAPTADTHVPVAYGGGRLRWEDLPVELRREVEAVAGARVVESTSVASGFSPGLASVVELDDGQRLFVKAARSADAPFAADLHRAEARIATRLPREIPAPRFAWGHGDGDWIVLAFEVVDGHVPATPWDPDELDRVLALLSVLAAAPGARRLRLPPTGPDFANMSTGWRSLVDDPDPGLADLVPWAARHLPELAEAERSTLVACEGEAFVHGDLRADNVLLTPDRAYLVDWPYASRGAPWLDLAMFLPSVVMQGVTGVVEPVTPSADDARRAHGGAWAAATFAAHPLGRDVHPADLRAVVAGVAGYFLHSARQPAPPDIPNLRAFQRAQGVAAVAWLEQIGLCPLRTTAAPAP